ncbi:fibronectin type III domain-containing protein [Candidatus Woesearchaeota archaeon]|nr:fibronectin type III domain-containing protein [Candidatus Woesearchaeota archaeon]
MAKITAVQSIAIFLIEIMLFMPFAFVDALTISEVKVENIRTTGASITWKTDELADSTVEFGKTNSLGQQERSDRLVKAHIANLNGLDPNASYFFKVSSAGVSVSTEVQPPTAADDNAGKLYQFNTLRQQPMFINATVPAKLNSGHTLSIPGKTLVFALVQLFINSTLREERVADKDGNFVFPGITLGENTHKIRITSRRESEFAEKQFSIVVDTKAPELELKDFPESTSSSEFFIAGTVSENVTLKFQVSLARPDKNPPSKIRNLNASITGQNAVKISWAQSKLANGTLTPDFARYIVLRDEIPIFSTDDISGNETTDARANANRSYTYQVIAMDIFGNIGEGEEKALSIGPEGRQDIPNIEAIDVFENLKSFQKSVTAKGKFNESIMLDEQDQFYNIQVLAIDGADNQVSVTKEILLDQTPPTIQVLSPVPGQSIFENFADEVVIRGATEPGARVYLFVNRHPFAEFSQKGDIAGIPNEIENLPEADLQADCEFKVLGLDRCRKHADYQAIADEEGFFEIEDVDLTSVFAGAIRIRQKNFTTFFPDELATLEGIKDSSQARVFIIAQDIAGKRAHQAFGYKVETCFSGNFTFSARPLVQYQSPTFLSVERLREGSEQIFFYFNFSYNGQAQRAFIQSLDIQKACGEFLGDPEQSARYNISCEVLGPCLARMNPDRTTAYVTCQLDRLEVLDNANITDLEKFLKGVAKEVAFPLKLTLNYEEEFPPAPVSNIPPAAIPQPGVVIEPAAAVPQAPNTLPNRNTGLQQTFCEEVTYVLDASFINPKDVLPDWLLYDFVDILNKTLTTLNEWLEKIREILEWLAISCVVAFLLKFVIQIYRRITCHYDRFYKKISGSIGETSKSGKDDCQKCIEQEKTERESLASSMTASGKKLYTADDKYYQASVENLIAGKQDIQDRLSNKCLKACYPTCSGAWKAEEMLYNAYRFACDRVFGHASPSGWTKDKSDEDLKKKLNLGVGCTQDQSVRGRPVRAQKCRELELKYSLIGKSFTEDDTCVEIEEPKGTSASFGGTLYKIGNPYDSNRGVYEMTAVTNPSKVEGEYIVKQNEKNYLYKRKETCEEVCGAKGREPPAKIVGKPKDPPPAPSGKAGEIDAGKKSQSFCMLASDCYNLQKEGQDKKSAGSIIKTIDDPKKGGPVPVTVDEARLEGYTSDCWEGYAPFYISGKPEERVECCCINPAVGQMSDYYVQSDVESKSDEDAKASDIGDMKWSYRYWKTNWRAPSGATAYNPNRYIAGRDFTACFGQNHIIYDGLSGRGNLLIIDPIKQHIAAFQCLAVSQIYNRLTLLKNILTSLQTCLLQIRTTGKADAGVCKELFSQFICSFLWKIITWVTDGCLPFGAGFDLSKSDNAFAEALGVGLKGVTDSIADSQTEIAQEYGNAKINNLLGAGQEAVFRKVCLLAFGYDWEIGLDDIIDAAYDVPFATLVQAVLPAREYLNFDPIARQSVYEYRSSWLINPGCDLAGYRVDLSCVTRDDMLQFPDVKGTPGGINCGKQGDPFGSNCDCLNAQVPPTAPAGGQTPYSGGGPADFFYEDRSTLSQNQYIEVDSSQIDRKIRTSPFRYDHLKFTLFPDQNYIRNGGNVKNCFPEGHENGVFYFPIVDYTARDITGCVVTTDGRFTCDSSTAFFFDQGNANIQQITLKNQAFTIAQNLQPQTATYYAGSSENIEGEVTYFSDGKSPQCLVVRLLDPAGNILETNQLNVQTLSPDLSASNAPYGTASTPGVKTAPFRVNRQITSEDIGGQGGFFKIFYIQNALEQSAAGFTVVDKTNAQEGTGSLAFTDSNANNVVPDPGDQYVIGTGGAVTLAASDCESTGCTIRLPVGVTLKASGLQKTPKGDYAYTFDSKRVAPTTVAGGATKFFLHLDLRHPNKANNDCQTVAGKSYDNTNIIVSGGLSQSINIPIEVLPGARTENNKKCEPRFEADIIEFEALGVKKQLSAAPGNDMTNICACSSAVQPNCPQKSAAGEYYKYCYGTCREYPKCNTGIDLTNSQCVCNPQTAPGNYDCGTLPSGDAITAGLPVAERKFCNENGGARSCGATQTNIPQQPTPQPPTKGSLSISLGGKSIPDNARTEIEKQRLVNGIIVVPQNFPNLKGISVDTLFGNINTAILSNLGSRWELTPITLSEKANNAILPIDETIVIKIDSGSNIIEERRDIKIIQPTTT